ncbi:MAG: ornithine cyclodeaminase [Rhodomicrobiaceae bacterium]
MHRISAERVDAALDWPSLIAAMCEAHSRPAHPEIGDMLLWQGKRSLLVRASIFAGLGIGLKALTVFPDNPSREPPKPTLQGEFLLFDEDDGRLLAAIDGAAITPWKTAADSALGASILARADVKVMAMIGAGAMAKPLIEAHVAARPSLERIVLWNRTKGNAEKLAAGLAHIGCQISVAEDAEAAVGGADIISTATLATEPLVHGRWLKPGVHLDLVGAYRPDMREADDEALRRGRIFADSRATTIEHIGELMLPIRNGVIGAADIEGDLFDLCQGRCRPRGADDITIFKNGGGAHLDLITARHIYGRTHSAA